ncbi:hypothetical protein BBK82_28250 [Lentzea guizhouensis]|uniref:DUF305 domain-containing protein n=1 Tax=Lentzea guizhouensis TaxID=1586287 RepID=A0A1B2HNU4_9PSEU|nr:hypothetical protein [Lentzea guizhouensis]ANZ39365.1 hypothetical protein BBK82_28250 [Lentzea guizhouensis]
MIVCLLAGLLAACQQAPPPTPAPPPTSVAQGGFGQTERAFVDLSIATNEQALKLLENAGRPELVANRHAELERLRALLDSPYVNLHEGHDMPGMPTDAEIQLAATDLQARDQYVRAHLTESLKVVKVARGH